MRVSQYKIVNELCSSLLEAYKIIESTKNYMLLGDCIDALSMIAESIENEDCPKFESTLIDMTELLTDNAANGANMPRLVLLAEKLQKLAKKELKYRLRVLFVAELSSKWDSMESVYEAFKKRDDVDIDVVLEPIFRAVNMPDGTVNSEIIYEDWLTPLGILNIPYAAYNMETIQPDITFISQPYESVTIPMFWPENIAKYSKLVYVPYFMSHTLQPYEVMAGALLLPAEQIAWKVLCQSDNMFEYFKEYSPSKGTNVIVSGLPKWDHILKLSKESIPCPADWKIKLKGKKVILLNTHFTLDFKSISDMDEMSIFKYVENSEELALIWRPHPMTDAIYKVYKQDKYRDYLELKEYVKNSQNIVLDENKSYDESFVWSDALMDSRSSLITQYALLRKPVFIVNSYGCEELEERNLDIASEGLFDFNEFYVAHNDDERVNLLDEFVLNKLPEIDWDKIIDKYYKMSSSGIGIGVTEYIIKAFMNEV